MSSLIGDVASWITDAVYSFGYFGIAVLVMLGNLHFPVPTGLVLPFAGFLVWQGRLSIILVMVAATIGAVVGSVLLYLIGLWIGEERLRQLIGWLERFKIMSVSHLDTADEMFDRHGFKAIFIAHLIPGVGSFISVPAGVRRMPFWKQFMIYTVIGTIPYNTLQVGLGWVLGTEWQQAEQYMSKLKYAIPVIIGILVLWYVGRRLERRWEARVYGPSTHGGRSQERQEEESSQATPWSQAEDRAGGGGGREPEEESHPGERRGLAGVMSRSRKQDRERQQLFCRLATPEKRLYEGEVDLVVARIADGDIGVMANHSPVFSAVEIGQVGLINDGDKRIFAVSEGFLEVSGNLVRILVEEALSPEEIDIDEAEHRIEKAEKDLEKISPDNEERESKQAEIERRRTVAENLVRVARKYAES